MGGFAANIVFRSVFSVDPEVLMERLSLLGEANGPGPLEDPR